ncbi:DNA polymerase kappa-like [Oppia nitens]|uniref:DNA polymerase kappa-like n=1 Tax=Oppia nitens TaxID=1686743 RepID=UPI0023DA0FE4|nr:DNA polymerase kappa-like [Oppia nitens]
MDNNNRQEIETNLGDNGVQISGSDGVPTIMNINDNKAGMTGLDTDRINKIIHEWSNGSHFHSFQTRRQQRIDGHINDMKKHLSTITVWQRQQCLKEADVYVKNIESERDMSRIIGLIDLDMFFAAVEIKYNPLLKDKPIAVGSEQMLGTSNYIARKYGIRPGMPGALAKRLCPQLIIIKGNYSSYSVESKAVMKIISEFDPNYMKMSLDEAYIDLTEYVIDIYCQQNVNFDRYCLKDCRQLPDDIWDTASLVMSKIRQRILDETQLSASAGIACNKMIAKVCSDINKPNGQHMVRGNRQEIEEFLVDTPIRKVCGIGPVSGQYLTALDIKTCKDLYHKRDIIRFALSQHNSDYYLRVGLGIGSHIISGDNEPQKSMSCERTVREISSFDAISDLMKELSEDLASDLIKRNQSCKTITIKLKKITFEVTLKSHTLPYYTCDSETILNVAKNLLETELSNTSANCRKYRLIGLKVSNLKSDDCDKRSTSQMTLSQIFKALKSNKNTETKVINSNETTGDNELTFNDINGDNEDIYTNGLDNDLNCISNVFECSVCFQEFHDKENLEMHENDCIDKILNITIDKSNVSETQNDEKDDKNDNNDVEELWPTLNIDNNDSNKSYLCPICANQLSFKDNVELNAHIDVCLNKNMCLELTKVPTRASTSNSTPKPVKTTKRMHSSDTKLNTKNSRNSESNNKKVESKKLQKTIDYFFHSQ